MGEAEGVVEGNGGLVCGPGADLGLACAAIRQFRECGLQQIMAMALQLVLGKQAQGFDQTQAIPLHMQPGKTYWPRSLCKEENIRSIFKDGIYLSVRKGLVPGQTGKAGGKKLGEGLHGIWSGKSNDRSTRTGGRP